MLKPEFTAQFKKDYKLAVKRGCSPDRFKEVVSLLCSETVDDQLLSGPSGRPPGKAPGGPDMNRQDKINAARGSAAAGGVSIDNKIPVSTIVLGILYIIIMRIDIIRII